MTDTISDEGVADEQKPVEPVLDEESVAAELVAQARAKGIDMRARAGCGPG